MYAFQPRIGYSQLKETGGNGIAGTAGVLDVQPQNTLSPLPAAMHLNDGLSARQLCDDQPKPVRVGARAQVLTGAV